MSSELSAYERWMVKSNLEYVKTEGFATAVNRLRVNGYNRIANAVEAAVKLYKEEIMIRYQLGYRHMNGEVEGFIGYGFTPDAAKTNAVKMAFEKVTNDCRQQFDGGRIMDKSSDCAPGELKILKTLENNQTYAQKTGVECDLTPNLELNHY